MSTIIRDNPANNRYEIWVADERVGFAVYQKSPTSIAFTHTQIEPEHEGQGYASQLVQYALDDVRGLNLPVVAICPYVKNWIDRHPAYHDMVHEN